MCTLMTRLRETYTPGYSEPSLRLMFERTAAKHAAFFTPFLQRGMRLLDCGCGPGTITLDLAKIVAPGHAFGIDLEPGQVRCAQDRAKQQQQTNASFQVASIYALPFEDGHFDAVFAHALFEHLREPVKALREMRRVLRSSGLVGVRSPGRPSCESAPSGSVSSVQRDADRKRRQPVRGENSKRSVTGSRILEYISLGFV